MTLTSCLVTEWAVTISLALVPAADGVGKVEFGVTDKKTGTQVPCRIHIKDSAGKPMRAESSLPFWDDHFCCPGTVQLDLPPGDYAYDFGPPGFVFHWTC